jgi:hypothetical protein
MSGYDFRQEFPNIDHIMDWYLRETLYCLRFYVDMKSDDAYRVIVSSEAFKTLILDKPGEVERETGYYWAMYLIYGKTWWKDKELVDQHVQYIRERHNPPMD